MTAVFKIAFSGSSGSSARGFFTPCLNLMILLQDDVLTSKQRLNAISIITDIYSPKVHPFNNDKSYDSRITAKEEDVNPFLAFFLDSLKYNSDPLEQHFLASRLTDPHEVRC